jgi:hypothetical protein
MFVRFVIVASVLCAASACFAETMNADAARRFVVGKLFAFNCFDGTQGAGRIYGDGSVIGSVQFGGKGPAKAVWMPAGTLRVKGETVCASVKGMPFEPCFNLNRTDRSSFRGSVSGMGFAYCDFTRHNASVAEAAPRLHPSQPMALHPAAYASQAGE